MGEKRVQAVFFHGLGGDPHYTWCAQADKSDLWPAWLAQDIPGLSIYSVGYEVPLSKWHGQAMSLPDQATNAFPRMLAEPALADGTFVLVAHSLGGFLIKQILRTAQAKAQNDENAASFLRRVEKVAFLGVPDALSSFAVLYNNLRILLRPTDALLYHMRNHPYSRDLNQWYRSWANNQNISHLILADAKPFRVLGVTLSEPDCADPGLTTAEIIPLNADAFTICKPIDRTDETYVHLRKFIEDRTKLPKEQPDEAESKVAKLEKAENWGEAHVLLSRSADGSDQHKNPAISNIVSNSRIAMAGVRRVFFLFPSRCRG